MVIKLIQITLQNFMAYADKTVNFGNVTRICGKNGKGKSSILTAYMWLIHNCDYELRDNPKVRKDGVTDADVVVQAVFDIDGKEVTAKKVQKRKFGKDGVSYSDDNTYFINDVPKTLRDFNDYFEIDMLSFKICSNVNAFLNQKPKEMRDFLFGTVDTIQDIDVARGFDELSELVPLLEKYKVEEIDAMNKASKAKVSKELPILDGQIKEAEINCQNDTDVAELCIKRNMLNEEIASLEAQIEDSNKIFESYQEKIDEISQLKSKAADMERESQYRLNEKRNVIQTRINEYESKFNQTRQNIKMTELSIASAKSDIERLTVEKKSLYEKYMQEKAKTYPEYEPLAELDPDSLICPTCGQTLPEDVKAQKIADYEIRVANHKVEYENGKAKFETTKATILNDIATKGNTTNDVIKAKTEDVAKLETEIASAKKESINAVSEKNKAIEEIDTLPVKVVMTDNAEYVAIMTAIAEKTDTLSSVNNGKDYRMQLKDKLSAVRAELSATELEIAKADTSAAEERLEQLRASRLDMEQAKADCEKYLDLLDKLDRHKNEMLADSINAKFSCVKWQLFELNKSGGYKSVCIPTMDGKSILDISSNKGNRILGKLDICNSIQKIVNINTTVFLDDSESLDDENTEKLVGMMSCQMVLLKVTNTDLKVEVAE